MDPIATLLLVIYSIAAAFGVLLIPMDEGAFVIVLKIYAALILVGLFLSACSWIGKKIKNVLMKPKDPYKDQISFVYTSQYNWMAR